MAQQENKIKIQFRRRICKLTICFYENPAAKQELVFWEGLMKDKIKSKSYINDIWSYHIHDVGENELVVCIPIDLIPGKGKYHKTLIFGKAQTEQLKFITIMMGLMERGKWK